jgi:hypothetical protein
MPVTFIFFLAFSRGQASAIKDEVDESTGMSTKFYQFG